MLMRMKERGCRILIAVVGLWDRSAADSALGVLVDIDESVAKQVMDAGCVTGNRINGLVDGLSGEWLAKYDLLTPAIKSGLPVTLVISRMELQEILLNAVGDHIV
ncbi:hypothetical protein Tco_0029320, partial [Tanacetum coccineum]